MVITETVVLRLEATNQYEVDKSVWRMEAVLICMHLSSCLWLAFVMCLACWWSFVFELPRCV